MQLTGRPARPSDHGECGSGFLRQRLRARHPIETPYDAMRVDVANARIVLNAVFVAKLSRENNVVKAMLSSIEFTGTRYRGETRLS